MMNKKYAIIIIFILFFILTCCGDNSAAKEYTEYAEYENLNPDNSIKIDLIDVSSTALTMLIENESNEEIICGESFDINYFFEDNWYVYDISFTYDEEEEISDISFVDIAYPVKSGDSLEMKYSWEMLYGTLSSGRYRIVIPIRKANGKTDDYYSCEFEIK